MRVLATVRYDRVTDAVPPFFTSSVPVCWQYQISLGGTSRETTTSSPRKVIASITFVGVVVDIHTSSVDGRLSDCNAISFLLSYSRCSTFEAAPTPHPPPRRLPYLVSLAKMGGMFQFPTHLGDGQSMCPRITRLDAIINEYSRSSGIVIADVGVARSLTN